MKCAAQSFTVLRRVPASSFHDALYDQAHVLQAGLGEAAIGQAGPQHACLMAFLGFDSVATRARTSSRKALTRPPWSRPASSTPASFTKVTTRRPRIAPPVSRSAAYASSSSASRRSVTCSGGGPPSAAAAAQWPLCAGGACAVSQASVKELLYGSLFGG